MQREHRRLSVGNLEPIEATAVDNGASDGHGSAWLKGLFPVENGSPDLGGF